MSQSLSRADKTLSKIVYELHLDPTRTKLEKLVVTTLCAQKEGGVRVDPSRAFSASAHIAFVATYEFSQRDAVEKFPVPGPAAKLLR